MKRITEVSIVTICETQPDLSWIGKYTDVPSDWVIVREEGKYLFDLNEKAKQAAYEYYVKECKDADEMPESIDNWSDGNWYYDLPSKSRECRFFKPYAGGEKEGSEDYQTYGLQDFRRMESYERQNWCMTGVKAVAKIQTRANANEDWLCNEVSSGGLWGIESDCDAADKKEVADGQLAELRNALKAFGFNNRQIDTAFENVQEIDGGYDN